MNTDHSEWTQITQNSADLPALQAKLKQSGITHLVFSIPAVDFILLHDPTGDHQRAIQAFEELRDTCLEEVYRDTEAVIYEIRCGERTVDGKPPSALLPPTPA